MATVVEPTRRYFHPDRTTTMEATIEVSGVRKRPGRTVPETIWLLAASMVLTGAGSTAVPPQDAGGMRGARRGGPPAPAAARWPRPRSPACPAPPGATL